MAKNVLASRTLPVRTSVRPCFHTTQSLANAATSFLKTGQYLNFLRVPKGDDVPRQQEAILKNGAPFLRDGVGVFGHSLGDGCLYLPSVYVRY